MPLAGASHHHPERVLHGLGTDDLPGGDVQGSSHGVAQVTAALPEHGDVAGTRAGYGERLAGRSDGNVVVLLDPLHDDGRGDAAATGSVAWIGAYTVSGGRPLCHRLSGRRHRLRLGFEE